MGKSKTKVKELEAEYLALSSLADSFSKEIKHEVEVLLGRNKIPLLFPIQTRIKSWTSIKEKLERLNLDILGITSEASPKIFFNLIKLYDEHIQILSNQIPYQV